MAKHKGIPLLLIGLIICVVSLFINFFNNGTTSFQGSNSLYDFFTGFVAYFNNLGNLGTIFSSSGISGVFLELFPLIFLVGGILVLVGITTRAVSIIGAILLIIPPIIYFIFDVFVLATQGTGIGTLVGYVGIGLYLELIGALICIIGGSINKGE